MTAEVRVIAWTRFDTSEVEPELIQGFPPGDGQLSLLSADRNYYFDYLLRNNDADLLAEFAGRACYQSWSRPNPETATNDGYLANILRQQHFSVLEHASVTFYITGVSRSFTHELVRHRHLSFSQLSQRYVNSADSRRDGFVVPPALRGLEAEDVLREVVEEAIATYEDIVEEATAAGKTRKQAREAARSVLPNCFETKIVVTGNHRSWREFIQKRTSPAADAEMQEVAGLIKSHLVEVAPNIYQDL